MVLDRGSTVFDLLALLCSMFSKEQEREFAIKWKTATVTEVKPFVRKFQNICRIILNASRSEYVLDDEDVYHVNRTLEEIDENNMDEVFLLAIKIEELLDEYSQWQGKGMIFALQSLNNNVQDTGVRIFPKGHPRWDMKKAEQNREQNINQNFKNYMIIREVDESPFRIQMHYYNDEGILKVTDNGWQLRVAIAPVMDYARLKVKDIDLPSGKAVEVQGMENEEEVETNIMRIFDVVFEKKFGIIMFPEAIGTPRVVRLVQDQMRLHPEYITFVLLPTYCENHHNTLTVLGPGGVVVLESDKGTPFYLRNDDNVCRRELLDYTNDIHILITRELGNVAFPICAEILDRDLNTKIREVGMANTIICPSFSPGNYAFRTTLLKGLAGKVLSVWLNTCSAKSVSLNGKLSNIIGLIQAPDASPDDAQHKVEQPCGGRCTEQGCYFEVNIDYVAEKFTIESLHCQCA